MVSDSLEDESMDVDGSIVVEELARDFGELRAVDSVNLTVPSGSIFGFLGPNGAAKPRS